MTNRTVSVSLWLFAILFTLATAYYQRLTGPTYPVNGSESVSGKHIEYRFLTSSETNAPAQITIAGEVGGMSAYAEFRRFRSNEPYSQAEFLVNEGKLTGELPAQPPAGKLEYNVYLLNGQQKVKLNDKPVVIRFKGPVPASVLIPHVVLMFLAMMFSARTGLEALRRGQMLKKYTLITTALLAAGGMILGPVVQEYAFGAYWTGWPFGHDLTDNKTLVAFLAWVTASIMIVRDNSKRGWAIAAALILLAVYLIPHSMFGSELDHTTGKIETGN